MVRNDGAGGCSRCPGSALPLLPLSLLRQEFERLVAIADERAAAPWVCSDHNTLY